MTTTAATVDRASIVALAIVDLMKQRADDLGVEYVSYGDQVKIPKTPAICVETGPLRREMRGAPLLVENNIDIYLLIYHSRMGDEEKTKLECDLLAEAVQDVLHEDVQLGGLVIHGFVTEINPGYARRSGTLLRVNRVTWQGLTKTRIPLPGA